jgi:hypothetical protein
MTGEALSLLDSVRPFLALDDVGECSPAEEWV